MKSTTKENASKNGGVPKVTPPSSTKGGASASGTAAQGPVSEEEIRAVLLQKAPVTTSDLVGTFKARLKTQEVHIMSFLRLFTNTFLVSGCYD